MLFALPMFAAELAEISVKSGQRKVLFDLLRPEIAKQAQMKKEEVKFEGGLKQLGMWGFFNGRSLNGNSQSLALEPFGNDDTCALFSKDEERLGAC